MINRLSNLERGPTMAQKEKLRVLSNWSPRRTPGNKSSALESDNSTRIKRKLRTRDKKTSTISPTCQSA